MSVNKVILIGRLGADPDVRYTPGGQAVANFNIATDEGYTDKNGQKQDKTEWHRIVAWGRTAELAGQYLKKGREVYIEGKLETREWQDKEGAKRYTTEVKVQALQFLGGRQEQGEGGYEAPHGGAPRGGGGGGGYGGRPQGGGGAPRGGNSGGYDGPPPGGPPPQGGGGFGGGPSGPQGGTFTDDDIPF